MPPFKLRRGAGKPSKDEMDAAGKKLLDACKRPPINIQKIQDLVESIPEAIEFRDSEGRTALHLACSNRAPLEVVQYLGNNSQGAFQRPTIKGMTPLHYACREKAVLPVVQYLVIQHSESLNAKTKSGWLPLHLACARQASTLVLKFLVESHPESLKIATQDGKLPLHFACANKSALPSIKVLVQNNPESLKIKDANEWTPLHIACAYSDNLELIEFLAKEWTGGLQEVGMKGLIPLHVACYEKRSLEIVKFLVQQWKKSLHELDRGENLPLHAAIKAAAPLPIIKYLIEQWPKSAYSIGDDAHEMAEYIHHYKGPSPTAEFVNWLERVVIRPSNVATTLSAGSGVYVPPSLERGGYSNVSISHIGFEPERQQGENQEFHVDATGNLQTEFQIFGDSVSTLPAYGRESTTDFHPFVPPSVALEPHQINEYGQKLHHACEAPQSIEIIQEIFRTCPQAIEHKAYGGILPIHTACLNQAPLDILEFLVGSSPQSLEKCDEDRNLPIHLACYSGAPLDSIKYLVRMKPSTLQQRNSSGNTPIDRARHPFYDVPDQDVVRWLEVQMESLSSPSMSNNHNSRGPVASASTSPPQRPGALMVNEPAARPDSLMYRQAFGEVSRPSSTNSINSASSSASSFQKPMGVSELRAKLDALRKSKKESRRELELNEDDEEEEEDPSDDRLPRQNNMFRSSEASLDILDGFDEVESLPNNTSDHFHASAPANLRLSRGVAGSRRGVMSQGMGPSSFRRPPPTNAMLSPTPTKRPTFSRYSPPNSPFVRLASPQQNASNGSLNRQFANVNLSPLQGSPAPPAKGPQAMPGPPLVPGELVLSPQPKKPPVARSSFYEAAITESRMMENQVAANMNRNSTQSPTRNSNIAPANSNNGNSQNDGEEVGERRPSQYSSFYRAALDASRNSEVPVEVPDNRKPPPRYGRARDGDGRQDNDVSSSVNSDSLLRNCDEMPSSFYRSAVQSVEQQELGISGSVATTSQNNYSTASHIPPATRRMSGPEVQDSDYPPARNVALDTSQNRDLQYNTNIHGQSNLEQPAMKKPGVVMVNEPCVRPDSAMYRAAYGNDQYGRNNGR